MPHRGWLQLGSTEIANTARTVAYMRNGVRNLSTEVVTDDSWAQLPMWLGRGEVWDRPEVDDDCPWYDRSEPASAEFAGVWPLSVDGLDATPLEREVAEGAISGGGFGVLRTPPRVVSVEALVIGATPAGLQYGLSWLGAALRSEMCEDGADPRQLLFLASSPRTDAQMTSDQVRRLANAEARMLSEVALTSPLTVDETFSPWVYEDHGATVAKVSFELTAGVPWVWRMPTPLVSGLVPADGLRETVRFSTADTTDPWGCEVGTQVLVDPRSAPLSTLPRPLSPAAAQAQMPFATKRTFWELEAGRLPRWAEAVASVSLRTGPVEERSIRFQWVRGTVRTASDVACNAIGEAMVAYVPANATLTLNAVTGAAEVVTADGRFMDATPVVTGREGGPWRPPVLRCAEMYTLVIDAADTVHGQVRVDVHAVVRES